MTQYIHRHHLRLDDATQAALEQICRHTFSTKSNIMRRYVQEGVAKDADAYAEGLKNLRNATSALFHAAR